MDLWTHLVVNHPLWAWWVVFAVITFAALVGTAWAERPQRRRRFRAGRRIRELRR